MKSLIERIEAKIQIESVTGCWVWQGSKQKSGHGHMTVAKKQSMAYRVSYELAKGRIPDGLDLDHLCRNPSCVNPEHLEPVTRKENLLRGNTIPAMNAAKNQCINGHPFTEENTSKAEGFRRCKTCCRDRANKRYHERKLSRGK